MWGGGACDEGLAGVFGRMNWGRGLGAVGRLECLSPHVVTRWEVRVWGKSDGGVGPEVGCRGPL